VQQNISLGISAIKRRLKKHLSKRLPLGQTVRGGKTMIRKYSDMQTSVKEKLRGGTGSALFRAVAEEGSVKHCRLFSEIILEKGSSIGEHDHVNETEYYWITEGEGIVTEADGEKRVTKGDLVVTGGGASHAIRNEKETPLKFLAVIILD